MSEFVAIEIAASLVNIDAAREDAEDLAWDHAKLAADAAGMDLGSVQFETIFATMRERYLDTADHIEFFSWNALLLLRSLLDSELVELKFEKPATDQDIANILGELSQSVVSSYAWLIAGNDLMWPANDLMPDTGVTFTFPSEDIIITES